MWINTSNARVAVSARRALRLNAARGTRLRAVRGTLWITIDDDPRDIVLGPGEGFVVDSDRLVVAMPLGECATLDFNSVSPTGDRPPRSWLHTLWRRVQPARGQATLPAPLTA